MSGKGKDGYQGDADALPWHDTLLSKHRNFRKATHRCTDFVNRLKEQRAYKLILANEDVLTVSRALELALFMDAKLDVPKVAAK